MGRSWPAACLAAALLVAVLGAAAAATTGDGSSSDPTDSATGYLDAVVSGNQATAWALCYPAIGATLKSGRIDWGDDTTENVGIGAPNLLHAYVYGGSYTIALTCTDSAGHSFTDEATIVAEGPARPVAAGGKQGVEAGKAVLLGRRRKTHGCKLGPAPDRGCSPGAYAENLTGAVICDQSFSPARLASVPASLRLAVAKAYGVQGRAVSLRHVVPVALGGANTLANLFPQRASAAARRARAKLEGELRGKVCSGAVGLRAAQRQLARNWKL
jgi:type IV secretory pathway VirB2 component (pilin)